MAIIGSPSRVSASLVSILVLAGLGSACGDSEETRRPETDTTPPAVVSTTPVDGAVDVPVDRTIGVVFSEPLRCDSVTAASVLVRASSAISGTVGCSGETVTFTPAEPLPDSSRIAVVLGTTIADVAGNTLVAPYEFAFTTAAESVVDTTPPTVVGTIPADGAADVAVDLAALTATFSEPLDCGSVTASSFQLGAAAIVGGSVTCTGASVGFTPAEPLDHETTYTATLATSIRDRAGNPLAAPYAWSFTTAVAADTTPPTVIASSPVDGATGVALDVTVRATFSEPVDVGTLAGAFELAHGGAPVPGDVTASAEQTELVFTPAAPLTAGTVYTATVGTGVTDLADNPLAAPVSWSFTTAAPAVRILYAWAGNLYVVGEDGSGGLVLAGRTSTESFAGVSPGGKVVYKIEDGDLRSVSLDKSDEVTLVTGIQPVDFLGFSSNGRVIYRREGNLHAVDLDGSDLITLADPGDVEPIARFAGGGRVLYLRSRGSYRTLHSVLDDGTDPLTLDDTLHMKTFFPLMPDGRTYYWRTVASAYPQDDVFAIGLDGQGPPITIAASPDWSESLTTVAPDGTPIVSGCPRLSCTEDVLFPGGAALNLGRGGVRGVTAANRIVFERGDPGERDIGTCDTAGAGVVDVAADPTLNENVVGVHPDGRVLYRAHTGTSSDLFSVNADGTGTVTLAGTGDWETFVGVSPGGWVVYQASGNGTEKLRAVRSDGTGTITLAESAYGLGFAGFSSSGKVLWTAGDDTGAVKLWIAGFEGEPAVKLTDHSGGLVPDFYRSVP